MRQMFALLRVQPRVSDAPGAAPLPAAYPLDLELRGVRFGYRAGRDVLRGLDLHVPAGTTCALVGGSGSGKSTVLRLLYRFYDAGAGAVLVGGQDVRNAQLASLRAAIGVVPQDTVLFNDSIFRNIEYGRPGAPATEVEAAARQASIHDAILAMPDGYGTLVGERGLKLSGGEKQRVALARAFLKNSRVLLCDEATSSLDSVTEGDIMDSLRALAAGRTALFIAHRLSTAMQCDMIAVLEDGRIVEKGTHETLLALNGKYAALWQAAWSKAENDDS